MRLLRLDVLSDVLRRGKPLGQAFFPDVILLLAAQESAEVHRELVRPPVVVGDSFGTDFMRGTVNFDRAEDLCGIEEGVEHKDNDTL